MLERNSGDKRTYHYTVKWSDEDSDYVGLCAEYPSLSWLAHTHEEALLGILKLVQDIIKDEEEN